MNDVFLFRTEQVYELATVRTGSSKVFGLKLVLFFTYDFGVNVLRFWRKKKIIVALKQLGWLVQDVFKNIMLLLIILPIARSVS